MGVLFKNAETVAQGIIQLKPGESFDLLISESMRHQGVLGICLDYALAEQPIQLADFLFYHELNGFSPDEILMRNPNILVVGDPDPLHLEHIIITRRRD